VIVAANETLLAQYVELKRSMRKLEAEIEALNEVIYPQIEAAGGKLAGPDYSISSRQRVNYRFSTTHQRRQEEIGHLRDQLKQLEEQEINAGVAEVESTTNIVTVRFN
jgi:hypothetical protein